MHLLHPSSTSHNCDRLLDCLLYLQGVTFGLQCAIVFKTIFSVFFCRKVKIITACLVTLTPPPPLLLLLLLLPVFHPNRRAEACHCASLCWMAVWDLDFNTNLTMNYRGRFVTSGSSSHGEALLAWTGKSTLHIWSVQFGGLLQNNRQVLFRP